MADDPRKSVGMFISSDPDRTSLEQPAADPGRKTPQLPLRLLLVSDLAPDRSGTDRSETDWSAGPSRVVRVDRQSFGEQMKAMSPRLQLEVPNRIAATPKLLDVALTFDTLDAFRPEAVAAQVPPLAALLELRRLVAAVGRGDADLETFRARVEAAGLDAGRAAALYEALAAPPPTERPAVPPPTERPAVPPTTERPADPPRPAPAAGRSPDALDRLFGMVSSGAAAGTPAGTPAGAVSVEPSRKAADPSGTSGVLDALIGAVAGASAAKPKVAKTAVESLLGDLDRTLGEQLNAVFGHPDFQRLEAAWRGLKFLVDRIDFRKNVQLEVLAAGREALSEALYHQVLLPEHAPDNPKAPLSAVVFDFAFGNGPDDLARLEDLVETGASLQAPLLAAAAPSFFGVAQYSGIGKLPPLWQQFEQPEYIAWNKLRQKQEARFLALALPAFALRYAYGRDLPAGAFTFDEQEPLWGNASLAVAARIAASFAETNWPTHLLGNSDRRIGDLPLWQGEQGRTPLAALVPEAKLAEFAKGGFVVLGGRPNHDALHVARAQTIALPEAYEDLMAATEARVHVTLACQLFVARAAHFVIDLQQHLAPVADVAETAAEIARRLRAFLHTDGHTVPPEAVEVEHVAEAGLADHALFALRLRPPGFVLDRPVSLVMGIRLPVTG